MINKILKQILFGIMMWCGLFFAGTIIMTTGNLDIVGYILMAIGPIISLPIAFWYFKTTNTTNIFREGLMLGIVWVIISILLDLIIMVGVFQLGIFYFMAWTLWVGYLEMLTFNSLLGFTLKHYTLIPNERNSKLNYDR